MIISRKKFNEAIREAEEKVYCKVTEDHYREERRTEEERRFDAVFQRIRRLEKQVFGEEEVTNIKGETFTACRY